jgi:diguanylate cyclase (GGDEF)-like protein/PAS domain S-box-containing protein
MWIAVMAGLYVVALSVFRVSPSRLGIPFLLLSIIAVGISSRVNIKIPGFKSSVSIADVFIFLTMLLFGGEAAVLLGATETLFSSLRVSRRPLTIAFNTAAMACSTFLTALIIRLTFGPAQSLVNNGDLTALITAATIMAGAQFVLNSGLVALAGALRAGCQVWETWKTHYLWTSVSYFASALAAAMIATLTVMIGFYSLAALLPIAGVVYLTYSTYLKNQEAAFSQAEQTARHLAELKESEERFHSAFDYAPIGMALVTLDGRWLQVNHSLCKIIGYREEELIGERFQTVTHPEDLDRFLQEVVNVLEGRAQSSQIEKRYVNKHGEEIWALVSISLIHDTQSRPSALVLQIQDISDRKRAEERLLHDAFHDPLTGLPNRAWFMDQLSVALSRARRHTSSRFAVLFLDLDRFKIINDSLGHMYGDQLLVGIARRLRHCLRTEDMIARLGGDEFTILVSDIRDQQDAITVAERIQAHLSQQFKLGGYETFTSVSIGIAFSDPDYEDPSDLLRDADTAMYQAKLAGKARFVVFDKGMHVRAMNTLQMENDLRRAVERKEFTLHYQPVISLETGELSGFEALVRWRHPERGLISPADFIPVAEETGLIVPLGQWVLREACLQMQRWIARSPELGDLWMSVNLSGKQFAHAGLLEQVMQTLSLTGLDPRRLKLEITESVVMENVDTAIWMLERLRALGVETCIDDFGTGYSSLSYLHRLPIDGLKIDRSFVGRMSRNSENREIIRTIIMLAQNLGKQVIAEGVETREQLDQLRELQCASGQGYFFSRPLDAEKATNFIQSVLQLRESISSAQMVGEDGFFDPLLASTRPM